MASASTIPMRLKRACPWCGGDQLYIVAKPATADTVRCYNGGCDYLELLPDHFLLHRVRKRVSRQPAPEFAPGFEPADHLKSTLSRRF